MAEIDAIGPAVVAVADLVGRSQGKEFEIGYFDDDPNNVTWWAQYKRDGDRIMVDGASDPAEAADNLAVRILVGGKCTHCHKTVHVIQRGPHICQWYREGDKWHRGCE